MDVKKTKPSVKLWFDITLHEVRCIQKCYTTDELKRWVSQKLQFTSSDLTIKEKILVDFFFYAICFCKQQKYNEEQTTAFYSIVKSTHDIACETSFGNLSETYKYFKELVIIHSAKRPPFCIFLFDIRQVKLIHDYMLTTYFRHFKLYKYVYTPKILMNLSISYQGMPETEEQRAKEEIKTEPAYLCGGVEGQTRDNCDDVSAKNTEDDVTVGKKEEVSSPAVQELMKIIESTLETQITQLRESVDEQLKTNDQKFARSTTMSPVKNPRNRKKK